MENLGKFCRYARRIYYFKFYEMDGFPFTKRVLKNVPMHQNIVKPNSVEKYMIALNDSRKND
jgi:hypothetical protein